MFVRIPKCRMWLVELKESANWISNLLRRCIIVSYHYIWCELFWTPPIVLQHLHKGKKIDKFVVPTLYCVFPNWPQTNSSIMIPRKYRQSVCGIKWRTNTTLLFNICFERLGYCVNIETISNLQPMLTRFWVFRPDFF